MLFILSGAHLLLQFTRLFPRPMLSTLRHYWPLFIFGTMIEFVTFFLVHPDLFTLVVCLKTTILLGIWLGREDRGVFVCRFVYHKFESKIDVKGHLAYHQTERKGNTP